MWLQCGGLKVTYEYSPYADAEALEERRWQSAYAEHKQQQEQSVKVNEIADLFPIELSEFNPNNPAYSHILTLDYAQELYAEFIDKLSAQAAYDMR